MQDRRGRPPIENPKSDRLYIRVTPGEKSEIQEACKKFNVKLLELIWKGIEAVKNN